MADFKKKPLSQRKEEARSILAKYPDRIPIICQKSSTCKNVPPIDKCKFLVPHDLTMGQFVYVIRKRIHLNSDKALFVFTGNVIPPTADLVKYIYDNHASEDGFLYVTYSGENTFGGQG